MWIIIHSCSISVAMEFKINEDFAKHYNEYRQKEEYQKLKSRYGDVKLLSKKRGGEEQNGEVSNGNSSDSSSSSSSSSDSDSEWEEQEHEDFLRLYDALCRNDPALDDEEKIWFREKPGDLEKPTSKEKKDQPVLLKDHTRDLLLSENGIAEEASIKVDGTADAQTLKKSFLA